MFSGGKDERRARGPGERVYVQLWYRSISSLSLRTLTGKGRARVLSPLGFYDSAGKISISKISRWTQRGQRTHSRTPLDLRSREAGETVEDR